MTDNELDQIAKSKIIEGPWKNLPENHLYKHKKLFDNLIELLSDMEQSDVEFPRDNLGRIIWDQISIGFLLQWTMLNAQKIEHKHGDS